MASFVLTLDTTAPVLEWTLTADGSYTAGDQVQVQFNLDDGIASTAVLNIFGIQTPFALSEEGGVWTAEGIVPEFQSNSAELSASLNVTVIDEVDNAKTYSSAVKVRPTVITEPPPEPVVPLTPGGLGGFGGVGGGIADKKQPYRWTEDKKLHPKTGFLELKAFSPKLKTQSGLSWHDEEEDMRIIQSALKLFGMDGDLEDNL